MAELKVIPRRKRLISIEDGRIAVEVQRSIHSGIDPWWERRLAYLRGAGRLELIESEKLQEIRARAAKLTR